MRFSGGKLNRGGFNTGRKTGNVLIADIKSSFRSIVKLTAKSSLSGAVRSRTRLAARAVLCLLGKAAAGSRLSGTARAGLLVPVQAAAASRFGGPLPFMRTTAYTAIDLAGLVLLPGETLVIDTDSITVTKDGVNAIEYWQLGSEPFLLAQGENNLLYFDGSADRKCHLSVTWKDRWL